MLLRSIAKHVKSQNWFAVFLDFLIVVVGILIALQITNWNESRKIQSSEAELEKRLTSEFKALEVELSERLIRAEGLLASTSGLIAAIRLGQEPTDVNRVKQMLLSASKFSAPVAAPTAFSDALQAGQIGSLSSNELRGALNDYVISTDWWKTVEGAPLPQVDSNSLFNQTITWMAPSTLSDSLSREVLAYDWNLLITAERELVATHRKQTLQAGAYELELIEVRNILAILKARE